jgi:hypothetical protein
MGRGFFSLGSFLLVATIAIWIAGAAEWIPESLDDQIAAVTLRAGLVLVAASLVLRLVSPVTKQLGKGRCAVCGVAIDRGSTYCLDHLQETVNAFRDRSRGGNPPPTKRRA